MWKILRPPKHKPPVAAEKIDKEYKRLRLQVFIGIFIGYAGYYLVRKNFTLAMPHLVEMGFDKGDLGIALSANAIAYGLSKFLMGGVSDRSNARVFLPLGLVLSALVTMFLGTSAGISSIIMMFITQFLIGWFQGMGWPPCGRNLVYKSGRFGRFLACPGWPECDHTQPIVIEMPGKCPKCGGKGRIIHQPCKDCRGSGMVRKKKTIQASIPAGIDNGQTISIRGQGNAGKNGGPAGDLLITITVRPHELFRREGTSVLCEAPITFTQAVLGAELEIPTIDGKVKYTLPEGTQSGTTFRLKGKGIPSINGRGRGDQYVTVRVQVPSSLTGEQKEALRGLPLPIQAWRSFFCPRRRSFRTSASVSATG